MSEWADDYVRALGTAENELAQRAQEHNLFFPQSEIDPERVRLADLYLRAQVAQGEKKERRAAKLEFAKFFREVMVGFRGELKIVEP